MNGVVTDNIANLVPLCLDCHRSAAFPGIEPPTSPTPAARRLQGLPRGYTAGIRSNGENPTWHTNFPTVRFFAFTRT